MSLRDQERTRTKVKTKILKAGIKNEYTNNEAEEQTGFSTLDNLFEDYEDLEFMTRKLIEEYTKGGLEVNLSKTEYLSIGGGQRDLISY